MVVELGLDPSKFTAGQRQAVAQAKQAQDQMLSIFKSIEHQAGNVSEFLAKTKNQVLGLVSVLLGGRGLQQFAEHVTQTDAALSRFARNFGQSIPNVAAWQKAVELAGGSGEGVTQSIQTISDAINEFQATSQGPGLQILQWLNSLSRATGVSVTATDLLQGNWLKLSDALSAYARTQGPAAAFWLGRQMGLTADFVQLLIKGRAEVQRYFEQGQRLTGEQAKNAAVSEKVLESWRRLEGAATNVGRAIFANFIPALTAASDKMADMLTKSLAEWENAPDSFWERLKRNLGIDAAREFFSRGLHGAAGAGEEPAPPGTTTTPAGVRVKTGPAGAGRFSPAMRSLSEDIFTSVPGLERVTAANDVFHAGRGAHGAGRAIDVTVPAGGDVQAAAAAINALLRERGIAGKAEVHTGTGRHVHVSVTPEAARRLGERRESDVLSFFPPGASALLGAGAAAVNNNQRTSMTNTEVHIAQLTVTTLAKDAQGVASELGPALERKIAAMHFNIGSV